MFQRGVTSDIHRHLVRIQFIFRLFYRSSLDTLLLHCGCTSSGNMGGIDSTGFRHRYSRASSIKICREFHSQRPLS